MSMVRRAILPTHAVLLLLPGCASGGDGGGRHVAQEVRTMAERIPQDLAREGPMAWSRYFARSPGFFMAVDGQLAFASNAAADSAMPAIARALRGVDLRWRSLCVDSLSPDLAVMAGPFTEGLTDSLGRTSSIAGYFSAVAVRSDSGWRLRNLHWSLAHPAAGP